MSELIAEARVLVRPDTTGFRSLLVTELAAASRGVTVPVQVAPVVTGAGLGSATALAAAQNDVADSSRRIADEMAGADVVRRRSAAGEIAQTRRLQGLSSGAASAGLSLVGLRGATLAATGPFLAGAAGAIALGKGLQLATSFNSQIAVLGATTGATGEQLTIAAEAAREFGRDITLPGVTAGDAAQTITEFAKAGLDLNDSLAATRGGLQLAQAAQLSYADAVTLTANALNAFGLSGNQAVRVADTLANASNLAQGGIEDTALALRQAAGAAAVVGVSFEDTTALLTLLARNGLTGSDAGTALRTAFLRLVNPSKQANRVLKDLNVNLRDAAGNVRPEVFAEFAEAQRDLSAATQQANAALVFGQDAFRAFGFLGREGTEGLREVQTGLEQTGTAARIAQARMTGLAGAQENLSNQLSSLGETAGQLATGPMTLLVDGLASYVSFVNEAVTGTIDFGKALGKIVIPEALRDQGGRAGGILGDIFGFTNPITGITSPAGQIKRIAELFSDEKDSAEEEIKNGGVELRGAIEDAGREASRGAVSFGDQISGAIQAANARIREAIASAQQNARNAALAGVRGAGGQAAGLEEQLDAIVAGGGTLQEQVANLRRQAQVQARIIERAGPDAQGVLLEARRAAQARLASINQQIVSIEGQITADQDRVNAEVRRLGEERQRNQAQAFLDAQADARARQERRVTLAEDTTGLQDDIRAQRGLRTLIQAQIQAIGQSVLDEAQKRSALRALRAARAATTDALRDLNREADEQREANRQAILDRTAENAALRTQIAEARGNKSAIIAAVDAEITIAQRALARAKQAKKGILAATLELEELRRKKRELLEAAEDETDDRGLTAFDILRENAETFARTGGNLVTGAQPFSGPTGFTADVAQFLHRPSTRVEMVEKPAPTTENLQRQVNEQLARLITALEQNTAAQGGNASTVDQGTILGARANAMARFYLSRQARQLTEAENA